MASEKNDIELVPVLLADGPSGSEKASAAYPADADPSHAESDAEEALLGARVTAGGRGFHEVRQRQSTFGLTKQIVIETAPTLLLATLGFLLSGKILSYFSTWKAMSAIDELVMIVMPLLNLKGNLEMNLSARLGTSANLGDLDVPTKRRSIIVGNLALLQVQATIVSFCAAIVAFASSRALPRMFGVHDDTSTEELAIRAAVLGHSSGAAEFLVVASSAMCAACLSSALLGSFMCGLVLLCRKFGLDPDNIAPAVAACLGDLVTLALLGLISEAHLGFLRRPLVPLLIIIALALAAACWTVVALRNSHVRPLLTKGWIPLFVAMAISSVAGVVLDASVERYVGFALLAVVYAGLPGAAGAIFVSRLSTALHASSGPDASSPPDARDATKAEAEEEWDARPAAAAAPSARLVLLTLAAVCACVELLLLVALRLARWLPLPPLFVSLQVPFFLLAVAVPLGIAEPMTTFLWRRGLDPDVCALPIQSAFTDLTGQLLLVACYEVASLARMQVAAS